METPLDNEIVVGEVEKAEKFEEARKPEMFKLWIDLGNKKVQSAAQLGYNHTTKEITGRKVLCATDLDEIQIAGFKSQALTLGTPDQNGNPILVKPDEEAPKGAKLY